MQEVRERDDLATRVPGAISGSSKGAEKLRRFVRVPVQLHSKFVRRFLAKVAIGDGCWIWDNVKRKRDYGVIGTFGNNAGKLRAHRVAFCLYRGMSLDAIDGVMVLHKCDNRHCVRPDHLFLGTAADNSNDMKSKGRQNIGIQNPSAKLSAEDVTRIRELDAEGTMRSKLAEMFGVSRPLITLICQRKNWSHV